MSSEAEFDAYLTAELDSAPLLDQGFSEAVAARLKRYRRRRRLALTGAGGLAGGVAAIIYHLSPAPVVAIHAITPGTIVATLVLATACSLAWIGTEARTPPWSASRSE
jgi:hypothetical protein